MSETDNPYTYAHKLKDGMTLWQHIDKFPDRLKNVNYTMVAQNSATSWTVGIFPFGAELNKIHTEDDTVLLVDVGGGMGQATRQIKQMCSNIKGRMVLQDRKEVTSTITENMPGIEVMAYDFFTPQPLKGMLFIPTFCHHPQSHCYYFSCCHFSSCRCQFSCRHYLSSCTRSLLPLPLILFLLQLICNTDHTTNSFTGALLYYIRRCLHDWPTEDCIKILKNIARAMDPSKSRLLISEAVLPLQGADPEAGWLDLTMMSAGGMERTEKQWIELLDASGFKLGKLWQVPGSIYAVVEAYLK